MTPSFRHVNKFLDTLLDDPAPTNPLGDDTIPVTQFYGDVVEMPVESLTDRLSTSELSVGFQSPYRSPVD